MAGELSESETSPPESVAPAGKPSWSQRYGERHRLVRVVDFPAGITGPEKVRVYRRHDHYVLQWWAPEAKQNLSDRVDGDLVAALFRARQIEERLTQFRRSGQGRRRLPHADLVARFLADLEQRADAGQVDPATARRYRTALRHYEAFCEQPEVLKAFPHAAGVNRDFRLTFSAFLAGRSTSPNGRAGAAGRPMRAQAFVLDTVRAMLEWAADPDRGNLLPDGFRNPFRRTGEARPAPQGDPLAAPDITLPMAVDLVRACDGYQLRLFAPLLLFGLRAAEPCFLFREYLDDAWLRVPCNPELEYRTKGRRDKRFPLIEDLAPLWCALREGAGEGLLYQRRCVVRGGEEAPWRDASLAELAGELRRRCGGAGSPSAGERLQLRDALLHEAGAMRYDDVEAELHALKRRLRWPAQATLKDFRHLFCTTMASAALPEPYRRYLMGHAPERGALTAYTHLPELRRHYAEAVRREWTPLLEAILQRLDGLRGQTV
jgi:hypothetical protein